MKLTRIPFGLRVVGGADAPWHKRRSAKRKGTMLAKALLTRLESEKRIPIPRYTRVSKARSVQVQQSNAMVRGLLKRLREVGVKG